MGSGPKWQDGVGASWLRGVPSVAVTMGGSSRGVHPRKPFLDVSVFQLRERRRKEGGKGERKGRQGGRWKEGGRPRTGLAKQVCRSNSVEAMRFSGWAEAARQLPNSGPGPGSENQLTAWT